MAIYTVNARATVSCWTKVEAGSEGEAIAIARDRILADFEISGSYPENEFFHFDNDGEPISLHAEEDD